MPWTQDFAWDKVPPDTPALMWAGQGLLKEVTIVQQLPTKVVIQTLAQMPYGYSNTIPKSQIFKVWLQGPNDAARATSAIAGIRQQLTSQKGYVMFPAVHNAVYQMISVWYAAVSNPEELAYHRLKSFTERHGWRNYHVSFRMTPQGPNTIIRPLNKEAN